MTWTRCNAGPLLIPNFGSLSLTGQLSPGLICRAKCLKSVPILSRFCQFFWLPVLIWPYLRLSRFLIGLSKGPGFYDSPEYKLQKSIIQLHTVVQIGQRLLLAFLTTVARLLRPLVVNFFLNAQAVLIF